MFNTKSKTDVIQQARIEAQEKQKKELDSLKLACKEIFKGNNGLHILKFIKTTCLWDSENTNIDKDLLAYRAGRRDIWLILRSLLPKDILAQVEIYDEN
jgi:hypothetical protein